MLAENLAEVFGRSSWNVSFHINMDASYMIGTDTFREGQVVFRPGPVYESAAHGGFCILDEINMARNEALAVLHSVLDFRRVINVPGYSRISVHEAAPLYCHHELRICRDQRSERSSDFPFHGH